MIFRTSCLCLLLFLLAGCRRGREAPPDWAPEKHLGQRNRPAAGSVPGGTEAPPATNAAPRQTGGLLSGMVETGEPPAAETPKPSLLQGIFETLETPSAQ